MHCFQKQSILYIETAKNSEMPNRKSSDDSTRIKYEEFLGHRLRHEQWTDVVTQFKQCNLPLTNENLKFHAELKKLSPRSFINCEILDSYKQYKASVCRDKVLRGLDYLEVLGEVVSSISKDVVYRIFSRYSLSFSVSSKYETSQLDLLTLLILIAHHRPPNQRKVTNV